MTPSAEAVRGLIERLDGMPGRSGAAELKRQFCGAWDLSPSSLSRLLRDNGVKSHDRADRGLPRKDVPEELIMRLLSFQCASKSLRKGDIMPARVAIHIAEINGEMEHGALSPNYFNRYLRERGISRQQRKAATPHVQLASVGPNHVHQVDFSLATNWKMSKNRIEFDPYAEDDTKLASPKAGEMRLWRMLVVDHATGVFFPYYGACHGETVSMLLEGLYYAWSEKRIGGESVMREFPFRGVPMILMHDRGSTTKSQVTKNVMRRLGVTMIESQGARAKGSVEVHNNLWENEFESRLRLETPRSVDQMNEWALDSAIAYCAGMVHRRTAMTRIDAWTHFINREAETRLRELRCDLSTFLSIALTNPESRLVRGGVISFGGREYRLPSELVHSERVLVQYSPFEFPAVQVRVSDEAEAPAWECQPMAKNHLGFEESAPIIGRDFKSHKKAEAVRTVDAARAAAEQLATEQHALKIYGHDRDGRGAQYTPRGEEVQIHEQAKFFTRVQAVVAIREALGDREFTPAERDYLATLPERVAEADIDAAIEALEKGVGARLVQMKAGGLA
jgi:hypothetical protein